MKQIIPFVKDISLAPKIYEVTSIALEHNLKMENSDSVVGSFTVSGKYRINDISINEEVFEENIPFDITLDSKYDASKVTIDIDDFYYEIINDEFLRVHIDVLVDNLVYEKKNVEKPAEIKKEERQSIMPNKEERNDDLMNDNVITSNKNEDALIREESAKKEVKEVVKKEVPEEVEIPEIISKVKNKSVQPRVYMMCGTEDFLYKQTCKVRELCEQSLSDFTYEEWPGHHEWDMWDEAIERMLKLFLGEGRIDFQD